MALEVTSWRAALLTAAVVSAAFGGWRLWNGGSRYANVGDQDFRSGVLPACSSTMAANRLKRVLDALGPAQYLVANGTQVSTGADNESREMRLCTAEISTDGRRGQAAFGLAWAKPDKSDITIVIGHGPPL